MKVVADTSPLCYLVLIDLIDLLPNLYDKIIIPRAVFNELSAPQAPDLVQLWIANPPDWLETQIVENQLDVELSQLDLGEQEAITLAESIGADLIILDDKAGRKIALHRGLRIIGLLGILGVAGQRGLVNLSVAIERLQQTNFRVSPSLLESFLERYQDTE
ncbi:MAG: DUF3368 domain-containing protein [Symploca sp. SIO1B1]|nr:DUF3368 domain-containing protein [Symploca sp. SIO1B1]